MKNLNMRKARDQGFTMVEVLIAFVIVTVGLLAIGVLQSDIIGTSAESKSRTEALTIAEGQLENFRSIHFNSEVTDQETWCDDIAGEVKSPDQPTGEYINDYALSAELTLSYVSGPGSDGKYGTGDDVVATATVNSDTSDVNSVCDAYGASLRPMGGELVLELSWDGSDQPIALNTRLSYLDPKTLVANVGALTDGAIDSPAGRAVIGEGYKQVESNDALDKNDDGTATVEDGNDLLLVDQQGKSGDVDDLNKKVYLTLEEACVSGNCTQFVSISGRIYVDRDALKINSNASFDFSNFFIKASDASYCRLWKEGVGDIPSTSDVSQPYKTPNEDYDFVSYTCYLGGGWYGNIGMILNGGVTKKDKLCMGDPNSNDPDEELAIEYRRAYRGMLQNASLTTGVSSIGILDGAQLTGHDFVYSQMNGNDIEGEKCRDNFTVVREDSKYTRDNLLVASANASPDDPGDNNLTGKAFEGNPTDFFCLNEATTVRDIDGNNVTVPLIDGGLDGSGNYVVDDNGNYIDITGSVTAATVPGSCPYDPTGAAVDKLFVEVQVEFPASVADADFTLNIVDNETTCDIASGAGTALHVYRCMVFEEGDNGWSGTIEIETKPDTQECAPVSLPYSGLTGDNGSVVDEGDTDIICTAIEEA
ncbi:type IV pilus modification PilV family protein [Marinobacterium litorale]|uniref:type IV pilus modification PilV family protein n=1 Tax=Marinobacterium litorale TaxID=404770 RepID=UPI0003F8E183|nr:prepilin-type N-terminal cleavage/methylation domain-containing protein [Marinobacterium litorale]